MLRLVDRVLYEPKGEVKERFLFENKERIILQKLGGICRDKSWKTKMEILTESITLQISRNVARKNSFVLNEW